MGARRTHGVRQAGSPLTKAGEANKAAAMVATRTQPRSITALGGAVPVILRAAIQDPREPMWGNGACLYVQVKQDMACSREVAD